MQDKFRAGERFATAADAFALDLVLGLAQTGGVNEHHGDAAHVGGFFAGVAGRAGDVRNDGAVVAVELIEEAGLAGVGAAHDGGADAASQNLTFIRRAEQFVHESEAAFQLAFQLGAGVGRDVFLGKIQMRLNVRERVHQVVAQLIDAGRKLAGELFIGRAQGEVRPRMNQVRHGFGLREVEAAIEEGALGELTGQGEARAVFQHGVEDGFGGENAAMTGDFHHVFAGVGARSAHHGAEDFVHRLAGADDFAVMNRVTGRRAGFGGILSNGNKCLVRHRERLRAGNTDDRQPALAERRGDRGNGVVEHAVRLQVESCGWQAGG